MPRGSVRPGLTDWSTHLLGDELSQNIVRRTPSLTRRVTGSHTGLDRERERFPGERLDLANGRRQPDKTIFRCHRGAAAGQCDGVDLQRPGH